MRAPRMAATVVMPAQRTTHGAQRDQLTGNFTAARTARIWPIKASSWSQCLQVLSCEGVDVMSHSTLTSKCTNCWPARPRNHATRNAFAPGCAPIVLVQSLPSRATAAKVTSSGPTWKLRDVPHDVPHAEASRKSRKNMEIRE